MKKVELQFEDYDNIVNTTKVLKVSEITKVQIIREDAYDRLTIIVNDKEIVTFSASTDFEVNVKEVE